MPLPIQTAEELVASKRFKNATNNREYAKHEIDLIKQLINHIGIRNIFNHYNMFTSLVSYELTNLLERWEWLKNNKPRTTLESFVIRFGPIIGPCKSREYGEKQRKSNSFEYKQNKFGWTKEQFDAYNKSRSVTFDLCIKRHGEVKGKEIWDSYVEQQRYTNSLEYFKEKYDETGYTKWLEYNQQKAKSGKIDWIMEKHGVGHDQALEIISSRYKSRFTSQAEHTFLDMLEGAIGQPIQYSLKNKQFCIWNTYLNAPCFYDLADSQRKKIIEFNGDYWHCNPSKYSAEYIHAHYKIPAKQVWEKEYLKKQAALDRGFMIKVVWEDDFQKNHEQIIKECVEWWNNS